MRRHHDLNGDRSIGTENKGQLRGRGWVFHMGNETETSVVLGGRSKRRRGQEQEEEPEGGGIGGECTVYQSLSTSFASTPYDLYDGVIFRVQAQTAISIVSLEIDLKYRDDANVKVFVKPGSFEDMYFSKENATSWQEVTASNAIAKEPPEKMSLIIPTKQFSPIQLASSEDILIYITVEAFPPRLKSAELDGDEVDDFYGGNGDLAAHIGYAVRGYEFSGSLVGARRFHGLIHYRTSLACEDTRTAFQMELPYFTDELKATPVIISVVNDRVREAMSRAMSRDVDLVRWQSFSSLQFQKYATVTREEDHQGLCPFGWSLCSKLIVTLNFGHAQDLDSGIVQHKLLKYATEFDLTNAPFELGYAGKMPLKLDYFVTLAGAPNNVELNYAQAQYFEKQTTQFLNELSGEEILATKVIAEAHTRHNRRLDIGRPQRKTQLTSYAEIHTAIYGAYDAWPEPIFANSTRGVNSENTTKILQRAFEEGQEVYVRYLTAGLIRPGLLDEGDSSEFFARITGATARLDENSLWFPPAAPTADPNPEVEVWGMSITGAKAFASILLIIGLIPILGLIILEMQRRRNEKEKLKRQARAAQRKVDKLKAEQYRRSTAAKKKKNEATAGTAVAQKEQPLRQTAQPTMKGSAPKPSKPAAQRKKASGQVQPTHVREVHQPTKKGPITPPPGTASQKMEQPAGTQRLQQPSKKGPGPAAPPKLSPSKQPGIAGEDKRQPLRKSPTPSKAPAKPQTPQGKKPAPALASKNEIAQNSTQSGKTPPKSKGMPTKVRSKQIPTRTPSKEGLATNAATEKSPPVQKGTTPTSVLGPTKKNPALRPEKAPSLPKAKASQCAANESGVTGRSTQNTAISAVQPIPTPSSSTQVDNDTKDSTSAISVPAPAPTPTQFPAPFSVQDELQSSSEPDEVLSASSGSTVSEPLLAPTPVPAPAPATLNFVASKVDDIRLKQVTKKQEPINPPDEQATPSIQTPASLPVAAGFNVTSSGTAEKLDPNTLPDDDLATSSTPISVPSASTAVDHSAVSTIPASSILPVPGTQSQATKESKTASDHDVDSASSFSASGPPDPSRT